MTRHAVAALADLPPGTRKRVVVEGLAIAVFNIGGELFALQDRCPHRGGSLSEGRLTGLVEAAEPGVYTYVRGGEILRCPWHGWEFDIRTGLSRCTPEQWRARTFEAKAAPLAAQYLEATTRAEANARVLSKAGDYPLLEIGRAHV